MAAITDSASQQTTRAHTNSTPLFPLLPAVSDPEPGVDSKIIAVVVVCSVLGIVLLLLLFVLLVWKISRQRGGKQSYAPSEKSRDSFRR